MKILHTSDLHLSTTGDERWRALRDIIALAKDEHVDLTVISGDMFDRKIAVDRLRSHLRAEFDSMAAPVLILPGNHDQGAFSTGQYFGERVTVMNDPGALFEAGGVKIFALPFERIDSSAVMERLLSLRGRTDPDATNILLFHGELMDIFFDRSHYGDEKDAGYMPVRLAAFAGLGFDYVLAGHFHTQFEIQSYGDGYFVYPGSPVSITRREQGRRRCNLFECGQPPRERLLDTFHYRTIVHKLDPFREGDPLDAIRIELESCHPSAAVELQVNGFIDLEARRLSEEDFRNELQKMTAGRVEKLTHGWRDIGAVLQNELYQRFEQRLRVSGHDASRAATMREMAIEAIMEVLNAD